MRTILRGLLNGYDYLVIYLGLAWLEYCAWHGRRLR